MADVADTAESDQAEMQVLWIAYALKAFSSSDIESMAKTMIVLAKQKGE